MAFINARLLDCVSFGTSGGPTFVTRKIALKNGIVRRNPLRSRPLYRYHVLYRNIDPDNHRLVNDAFIACYAGVHSFRLKDWHDYQADDELIGVAIAGAQEMQLIKSYAFGSQSVERAIRKPVSGTVTLTSNGSPLAATVDYATGIATFNGTAGHLIRWSGEFDVPVMFEQDELPFSGEDRGAGGLFLTGDVPLVEDISV